MRRAVLEVHLRRAARSGLDSVADPQAQARPRVAPRDRAGGAAVNGRVQNRERRDPGSRWSGRRDLGADGGRHDGSRARSLRVEQIAQVVPCRKREAEQQDEDREARERSCPRRPPDSARNPPQAAARRLGRGRAPRMARPRAPGRRRGRLARTCMPPERPMISVSAFGLGRTSHWRPSSTGRIHRRRSWRSCSRHRISGAAADPTSVLGAARPGGLPLPARASCWYCTPKRNGPANA